VSLESAVLTLAGGRCQVFWHSGAKTEKSCDFDDPLLDFIKSSRLNVESTKGIIIIS
jgi:hypothetical protein